MKYTKEFDELNTLDPTFTSRRVENIGDLGSDYNHPNSSFPYVAGEYNVGLSGPSVMRYPPLTDKDIETYDYDTRKGIDF